MFAVVCITRNQKGEVNYHSGMIYFHSQEEMKKFRSQVAMENYEVDLQRAHAPEGKGKGYWCPYCQTWETWVTSPEGFKVCPICGMTHSDFYVRNYNNLWKKGTN